MRQVRRQFMTRLLAGAAITATAVGGSTAWAQGA